ncbi:hypothetical protein KEM48_000597 [Puccinia striiformis f. sp. tritici PST-130]|nr:hypothetical protein KEM48_000597 [Puccinia striiformis f. sp. tritici PST-130]
MRSFLLFPIFSFFASSLAQVIHRDHRTIQFYCPANNPQAVCTRVTERQNDRPNANPLFMAVRDATAVYGKTSAYNCINLKSDDHYCCPTNSYHFHGDDEITRSERSTQTQMCTYSPTQRSPSLLWGTSQSHTNPKAGLEQYARKILDCLDFKLVVGA